MIGYVIAQELRNAQPQLTVAALLTQTVVDPNDPAFSHPTKPIGPIYAVAAAQTASAEHGWHFKTEGEGMRRVVPSPLPAEIVELPVIKRFIAEGMTIVCCGGGGIPVQARSDGTVSGVEAVVDKDLVAALLAMQMQADRLIILTDVRAVYLDWGTSAQKPIGTIRATDLERHVFAEGSMGPKVLAACNFVEKTGRAAIIGSLAEAEAVIAQQAGTLVTL